VIRVWFRLAAVALWCLAATPLPLAARLITLGRPGARARGRTVLMTGFSRGLCRILGVRVEVRGAPPPAPAFVAPNHWGYLDIFVLGSVYRGLFVSRADVAGWPLFGFLSRSAGTLFLRREVRRDTARVGGEIGEALRDGFRVTAFLEGGAGPGTEVRPFRSALLESAVAAGTPCTAVAIRYELPRDPALDPSEVVAWTEGGFVPHVVRLVRARRIVAHVTFLPPRTGADRKELARLLEADVAAALRAL
jgi:1-acyl-sn-glycerol-3-phosphate acyltransferase